MMKQRVSPITTVPCSNPANTSSFSPEASTIVSEWGLVCSKSWVPSFIVSLQMAGVLVASPLAGFLADAVGRKTTIYSAQAAVVVLNVISIFSTSWEMFTAVRFILAFVMSFILTLDKVYYMEFVTPKWRSILGGIPQWTVCGIFFAITCIYLKDWRQIHIVSAVLGVAGFIPVFWVPESLRWLEVKNRMNRFERVANKITRMNGKNLPPLEIGDDILGREKPMTYNFSHLLRGEYRKYSLLLILPWISVNLCMITFNFGVKAFYGNFYLNLILMNAIPLPFCFVLMLLPNLIGRKLSACVFSFILFACLLTAACVDTLTSGGVKVKVVLVLVFTTRIFVGFYSALMAVYTLELYPTVIRGQGAGWGYTVGRVGSVVAPYLIPNDQETFYIAYIIMAVLFLLSALVILNLPETKGQRLQENMS